MNEREINLVNQLLEDKSFLHRLRVVSHWRSAKTYGMKLSDWTPMQWGCALGGEVGELQNVVKKIERDGETPELILQAHDEAADVAIYLDLLCNRMGINLEEAIARKFNQDSQKRGFPISLEPTNQQEND